jgi:hypothetical protein
MSAAAKPKPLSEKELVSKIQRAVRTRDMGKRAYKRADALLSEIVKEMKVGQVVQVSNERAYELVDNFAGKDIVWNPCAARRWELEEVPVLKVVS